MNNKRFFVVYFAASVLFFGVVQAEAPLVANVQEEVEGFPNPFDIYSINGSEPRQANYRKLALVMTLQRWLPIIDSCARCGDNHAIDTLKAADELAGKREKIVIRVEGKELGWVDTKNKMIYTPVGDNGPDIIHQPDIHGVTLSFDQFEKLRQHPELMKLARAETVVWNNDGGRSGYSAIDCK